MGTRVNYDMSGTRSLFTSIGRKADDMVPPFKEAMLAADDKWAVPQLWGTMRQSLRAYRPSFFLSALDLTRSPEGDIIRVPENRRITVGLFIKTFFVGPLITFTCFPAGLSYRTSAGAPAHKICQPFDDPCASAILDIAFAAHQKLDGSLAKTRG